MSGVESLYECKLKDISPANKLHSKNNNFLSAAAYFNNGNSIISLSDDGVLKKINEKTNQPQSLNTFDTHCNMHKGIFRHCILEMGLSRCSNSF